MIKSTILTIVFLAILLYAAFSPMPQKARIVIPDLIIRPISLDEALDASLACGDGRKVDFGPFGLSWEG